MKETPEEFEQRNQYVIEQEMRDIEHGVSHEVWIVNAVGLEGHTKPVDPVVQMANHDDGHYVQTFKSREEINEFIATLERQRDEVWPTK